MKIDPSLEYITSVLFHTFPSSTSFPSYVSGSYIHSMTVDCHMLACERHVVYFVSLLNLFRLQESASLAAKTSDMLRNDRLCHAPGVRMMERGVCV